MGTHDSFIWPKKQKKYCTETPWLAFLTWNVHKTWMKIAKSCVAFYLT